MLCGVDRLAYYPPLRRMHSSPIRTSWEPERILRQGYGLNDLAGSDSQLWSPPRRDRSPPELQIRRTDRRQETPMDSPHAVASIPLSVDAAATAQAPTKRRPMTAARAKKVRSRVAMYFDARFQA